MEKQKRKLPKWLIKTQHGSWEPEIFISGIVLIGLIQLPEYLVEFRYYFSREIFGLSTDIDNLIAVLITGIYWMIFGLGLHLFIRGIWIGLVGLSYVFPNGINKKGLGYTKKFDQVLDNIPDVTEQVIKLEKISSSIFSINYLIFMSILGAYFFIIFAIVAPVYTFILLTDYTLVEAFNQDSTLSSIIQYYARVMVAIGGVYMFDFLTLGLVKRVRLTNKLYYPIYRFVSFVTFSKLYRNIYYLLISNFKKWKVMVFLVLFTVLTIMMIAQNAGNSSLSRNMSQLEFYKGSAENIVRLSSYDNLNKDVKWIDASIQSDIIHSNTLRVFISGRANYNDSIRMVCDNKIEDKDSDAFNFECLKNFYQLSINDSAMIVDRWFSHLHANTRNRGYMTYLDISHLNNGLHELQVDLNWRHEDREFDVIPFYLDR